MKKIVSYVVVSGLMFSAGAQGALEHSHDIEDDNIQMMCIGDTCPRYNSIPALGSDGSDLNADGNESIYGSLLSEPEYINATIIGDLVDGRIIVTNSITNEVAQVDPNNSDIELLDKDGLITDDLAGATMAYVPSTRFYKLSVQVAGPGGGAAARKGSIWNECTSSVRGGYLGKGCARRRRVHNSLLKMLGKLPGLVGAKSVYITHAGIAGDGNHRRRRSLHNTNRAIDIRALKVKGVNYVYRKAAVRNGRERRFYNKLISRWESSVRKMCGHVVAATTIKWNNKHHRKHGHFGTTYKCR